MNLSSKKSIQGVKFPDRYSQNVKLLHSLVFYIDKVEVNINIDLTEAVSECVGLIHLVQDT